MSTFAFRPFPAIALGSLLLPGGLISHPDLCYAQYAPSGIASPPPESRNFQAIESGRKWMKKDAADKSPALITYGFETRTGNFSLSTASGSSNVIAVGPPTAAQAAQFVAVTKEIERTANIRFVAMPPGAHVVTNMVVADETQPMLLVRAGNLLQAGWAGMGLLPEDGKQCVITLDSRELNGVKGPGGFSYAEILHETLHTLGLKHPFDNISFPGHTQTLNQYEDCQNLTVMSYTASSGLTEGGKAAGRDNDAAPATLMVLDRAALEDEYGPSLLPATNAQVPLTGERKAYCVGSGNLPLTFDASCYTGKELATFDLNPGASHPTHIGDEYVFIAYDSTVDTAKGAPDAYLNQFTGNLAGRSAMTGGTHSNFFTVYRTGNDITPRGANNQCTLTAGSETRIEGFDPEKDYFAVSLPGAVTATSHTEGNATQVEITSGASAPIRLTLEGYSGASQRIRLFDVMTRRAETVIADNTPLPPAFSHVAGLASAVAKEKDGRAR